jgi:protein DJ-1
MNTTLRLTLGICGRNSRLALPGIKRDLSLPHLHSRGQLDTSRHLHTSFIQSTTFAKAPSTREKATMGKKALVIIADGSEEIEAVTPVDTLRRAEVEVTVAGLTGAVNMTMSRGVIMGAEKSLKEAVAAGPYDAVILPGGLKGAGSFAESAEVGDLLKEQEKAGRLVAAICAGPTALHKHGIYVGKSITSYPSVKEKMLVDGKYNYKEERVVVDGNLITSRGPATSLEFSLAILAHLVGQEKADEVGKGMLFQ